MIEMEKMYKRLERISSKRKSGFLKFPGVHKAQMKASMTIGSNEI